MGDPGPKVQKMVDRTKTVIETIGFQQIVEGVTRSWNTQPDSNIDHIWMNKPSRLVFYRNIVRAYSDHNLILFAIRTMDKQTDKHEIVMRDRRKLDLKEFKSDLAGIEWDNFFECEDLDILNSMFEDKFLQVLNKHAPMRIIQKRKQFRNWMDNEVKTQMKIRDELHESARNSRRMEDWVEYRSQRNRCVKLLKNAKKNHFSKLYRDIEEEKDVKKLHKLTNELVDKRNGNTPQTFIVNGRPVRKQKEMCNIQMNFYTEKIKNLIKKIPHSTRNPHRFLDSAMNSWEGKDARPIFEFREISFLETEKLVSKMKNSAAAGHDTIDAIGIKDGGVHLVRQIRHIINMSLRKGKFVRKWKFSKLTPRLKSFDLEKN